MDSHRSTSYKRRWTDTRQTDIQVYICTFAHPDRFLDKQGDKPVERRHYTRCIRRHTHRQTDSSQTKCHVREAVTRMSLIALSLSLSQLVPRVPKEVAE